MEKTVGAQSARKVQKTSKVEYLIVGTVVFAVLMLIVYNYMQVAAMTVDASALKKELLELQSQENALRAKQEQIFNLADVESMARGQLGMIKLDKSQITYIEATNPDVVNIVDNKKDLPAIVEGALKTFNIVVEYLN